jgi:creatinine amidohydrolase
MFKLTRPEIEEYMENRDIILLPIGSTEQHGLHLPVGNDSYHASKISRKVAEKTGTLVAPTLPYGNSYHQMNFSGTIIRSYGTLVKVIKEICRSLHEKSLS